MEIPAWSHAQFEVNRAVAERFVDHRHVVETTEEKKRSFQREFQLKISRTIISPSVRFVRGRTEEGKGMEPSF